MDKVEKALKKFSVKEGEQVKQILEQLYSENYKNLDIRKLKIKEDIFRVRKDNIRVIYRQQNGDIFILAIERRSDNTYKNL